MTVCALGLAGASDMGVECAMSLAGVEGGPWIITGDDHAPPDSSELLTEASS